MTLNTPKKMFSSGLHFRPDPVDVVCDVGVDPGDLDPAEGCAVGDDPRQEQRVALLARLRSRKQRAAGVPAARVHSC